jgi:hypothetical protein
LCRHKNQFYWMQIIFLSGTKCLWLAQYVNKFLVRHKNFVTCKRTRHWWLFCKDHFSIYYIKSFDLVTVFVETKSVTKSRLHCSLTLNNLHYILSEPKKAARLAHEPLLWSMTRPSKRENQNFVIVIRIFVSFIFGSKVH